MTKNTADLIQTQIIVATPAMAKGWLNANKRNRTISELTVNKYRGDMIAGRWQFAADPIRFDIDGNLLDGQHRLSALADCPASTRVQLLIISGLPAETQLIMDQGKRRSPGDQLSLLGVKDANVVAAGVRLFIAHETGLMFRDNHMAQVSITNAQMEAWYMLHTDLVEAASSVGHLKASDAPPSVAFCAALMFINVMDLEATQEFFRLLAVGAGEGHPINTLDKRLQRIRRERLRVSPRDYLALFIQAANAWREGRRVSKFQKPHGARWTADTYPKLVDITALREAVIDGAIAGAKASSRPKTA